MTVPELVTTPARQSSVFRARQIAGEYVERVDALFCVDSLFSLNGPEKRMLRLARAWKARGHSTAVLSIRDRDPARQAPVVDIEMPVFAATRSAERNVLKSHRYDVHFTIRSLCKSLRPKLVFAMESLVDYHVRVGLIWTSTPVITLLGIDRWRWERPARWYRIVVARWLAAHRGAVIGNSQGCLEGWRRVIGDDRFERTVHTVLLNPFDARDFELRRSNRADGPPAPRVPWVIGGLGRFEPQKGFDLLIRAFASLPAEVDGRATTLRLMGGGSALEELRQLVRELGVEARVEFVPHGPGVEAFLHSLDLLVVPSRWAGFDNVGVESILTGTPTLVTRESGLWQLECRDHLNFTAAQSVEMSHAIERILSLPDADRAARTMEQRALVLKELDAARIAAQLEDFLIDSKLLAARSSR